MTLNPAQESSPCSILGATVDVCTVFQQHLDNLSPASRGCLMESCITSIITAIDLPDVLLQTILDYVLQHKVRTHKMGQRGVQFNDKYNTSCTASISDRVLVSRRISKSFQKDEPSSRSMDHKIFSTFG